jgi:lysophospholipase L1-like esterase
MRVLQLILISLMAMSGCTKKGDTPAKHTVTTKKPDTTVIIKPMHTDTITYLALGDSYTVGEAEPQEQSFPYQLADSLRLDGYVNTEDPEIIAVTGWTTLNLITAINNHAPLPHTYSFVTLLIGVNDQFQGASQSGYRINFVQLLNTAISYAGGDKTRVFVLSIPDYGVTPFAGGQDAVIGPEIDAFNAINREESGNAGVNYLDITDISREAASDLSLIAPDGLHPSGKMYTQWILKLLPMVESRLGKK